MNNVGDIAFEAATTLPDNSIDEAIYFYSAASKKLRRLAGIGTIIPGYGIIASLEQVGALVFPGVAVTGVPFSGIALNDLGQVRCHRRGDRLWSALNGHSAEFLKRRTDRTRRGGSCSSAPFMQESFESAQELDQVSEIVFGEDLADSFGHGREGLSAGLDVGLFNR